MSNIKEQNKQEETGMVSFAAIEKVVETNIIAPTETKVRGKDVIYWGVANNYPDYLLSLYEDVPTLGSVIDGCVDYVAGDNVTCTMPLQPNGAMNKQGETIIDLVRAAAFQFFLTGGFAIEGILRQDMNGLAEVYIPKMKDIRTNKDNSVFYYSEKWGEKYARQDSCIVYPKFVAGQNHPTFIHYVKGKNIHTYPIPIFAKAIKSCEIERAIDNFHLNSIENGLASSHLVNFNNGVPADSVRAEVERDFNEKFSGHQNAGRVMFSWNMNKESAATIDDLNVQDFGEKYNTLAARSRQQIFTAFRANPNLFGIPTESLGFSSEEYQSAFDLFNRTQIKPVQDIIVDAFEKIFQTKGVVTITPFSINSQTKEVK